MKCLFFPAARWSLCVYSGMLNLHAYCCLSWRYSRGSWTAICQVCFEVDSCNAQGVGLDGLVGPFQLYYSMILSLESLPHGKDAGWLTKKTRRSEHVCMCWTAPQNV